MGIYPDDEKDGDGNLIGAKITAVAPGGPASAAGLLTGDVICEVNGSKVDSQSGLRELLDALKGGEPAHNAALMRALLAGDAGPLRDIVLLNSAAGFIVAARAGDLREGVALAADVLDSGAASRVLDRLVAETNR